MGLLALPERLDISTAASLREEFGRLLAEDAPIEIDASGVSVADTAGVQLLLALARSASRLDREPAFRDVSPRLMQAVAQLGLDDLLFPAGTAAAPAPKGD